MRSRVFAVLMSISLLVATAVSSPAQIAPEKPMLSGKGMKSKLGLVYLGGNSPGLQMLLERGRIPIIKLGVGDFGGPNSVGHRLKQKNPRAIIFVGAGISSKELRPDRDPAEVFNGWLKAQEGNLRVYQANSKLIDYLSFMPNMWEPKTVEIAQWYCRYVTYAAPRIAQMGFRPIILQSGVGGLPIEPQILDAMVPAFRVAKRYGGAWACHGYTLEYTKDARVESFYSLRYRKAYEYLRKAHPNVADLTMILMEAGVDKAGDPDKDGWQARGTKEKYIDWLTWFDAELCKDPQVLGAALFAIGCGSGWKSFDVEPITGWLADYWDRKAASVK
ncbi:MAG: hypothetical protein ACPL7O_12455 [Armatimonadota bacterium]